MSSLINQHGNNIRGNNMPRRKKKVINKSNLTVKTTELGTKYNNMVTQINNIIINNYNLFLNNDDNNEDDYNKYKLSKEIILDKFEELGYSLDKSDLLKKTIFSYKEDIKDDRLDFIILLLLENHENPYTFKLNIYNDILIKNFEQDWLANVFIPIINDILSALI